MPTSRCRAASFTNASGSSCSVKESRGPSAFRSCTPGNARNGFGSTGVSKVRITCRNALFTSARGLHVHEFAVADDPDPVAHTLDLRKHVREEHRAPLGP